MFQVKLFRIKKGLSQAELSEILGCDQANISRMENNRIPMAQIYVDILKTKYGEEISEYISDGKPSKLLGAFGWKSKGEEGYEEIRNKLVELLEVIRVKTGLSAEDVSQKLYRRRKAIPNALYGDVISPDTTVFILKNAKKLGLTASELMLPNSSANSKGENKKGQILKKRILKKYNHMETKKKIIQEIEDAVDIVFIAYLNRKLFSNKSKIAAKLQ